MLTSRRRPRKGHAPVQTESLETRTLLTTANLTITELLNAQADDSGRIDTFIETGRISVNSGKNLNRHLLKALELTRRGNHEGAQKKLDDFEAVAERLVAQDKLSRKDADELIDQGLNDRNSGDYDLLRQAVVDTGLGPVLNRFRASFTAFAPTDRAFMDLSEALGNNPDSETEAYNDVLDALGNFGDGNPIPVLREVVKYHVLREELTFTQVVKSKSLTTFGGGKLIPDGRFLQDVDTDLDDAKLNKGRSNVPVKNGVVHTVNQVMIPVDLVIGQTVTEIVAASGNGFDSNKNDFDILKTALEATELDETLDNPDLDVTVFAPTDQAFIRFARKLGLEGNSEEDAFNTIVDFLTDPGEEGGFPGLEDVVDLLLYHVSPGAQSVKQIRRSDSVATLEGSTITPDGRTLGDQDPELADPVISKSRSDIPAENGVVHVIDRLLLNEDYAVSATFADLVSATNGEFDSEKGDFDILSHAVTDTGLVDTLADPSQNLTLFAPTDFAFVTFARQLGYAGVDEQGAYEAIVDALTTLGGGDPIPLLTDVLLYHAVAGTNTVESLRATRTVTTLQGNTVEVKPRRLVDNDDDFENGTISKRRSNIVVENGIAHVVSRLLLPVDLP